MIYPIGDIGMAAFAVFFMQSPSFLAHQQRLQRGHGRSNAETLFGVEHTPRDNHIRTMLYPAFATAQNELEQSGGLEPSAGSASTC